MPDAVWLKPQSGSLFTLFIKLINFFFNLGVYCTRSCMVERTRVKATRGEKKAVNSEHTEQPTQSGTATWITSHSLLLHTPYHVACRMGLNNIQWLWTRCSTSSHLICFWTHWSFWSQAPSNYCNIPTYISFWAIFYSRVFQLEIQLILSHGYTQIELY